LSVFKCLCSFLYLFLPLILSSRIVPQNMGYIPAHILGHILGDIPAQNIACVINCNKSQSQPVETAEISVSWKVRLGPLPLNGFV
jgi:hypothetical protein